MHAPRHDEDGNANHENAHHSIVSAAEKFRELSDIICVGPMAEEIIEDLDNRASFELGAVSGRVLLPYDP